MKALNIGKEVAALERMSAKPLCKTGRSGSTVSRLIKWVTRSASDGRGLGRDPSDCPLRCRNSRSESPTLSLQLYPRPATATDQIRLDAELGKASDGTDFLLMPL
jgi:hypothetical protein